MQKTLLSSLIILANTAFAGDRVYEYSMSGGVPLFTDKKLSGVSPATVSYYGRPSAISSSKGCSIKSQRVKRWMEKHGPTVEDLSNQHDVDERLIKAVIAAESCFNHKAVSRVGAQGLMQLMPGTAKLVGVKDPFDPAQNMQGGVRYLRMMLDEFNQDQRLALAAYNAGPGAVKKYNNEVPPYKETQHYVSKILKMLN